MERNIEKKQIERPREKAIRQWMKWTYGELAILMVGYAIDQIAPYYYAGIQSWNITIGIFVWGAVIWLILAFIHCFLGYKSMRKESVPWYKQWRVFRGIANICFALLLFCITRIPYVVSTPNYTLMYFSIFFALAWVSFCILSGVLARKSH